MSAFEGIALILGATLSAVYLLIVLQREIRSLNLVLQTGVEEGVPVTVEYRWMVLWTFYLPTAMFAIALLTILALAAIQIGMNVADLKIRTLAYLCAAGAGTSTIMWSIGLANGLILHIPTLRKASKK